MTVNIDIFGPNLWHRVGGDQAGGVGYSLTEGQLADPLHSACCWGQVEATRRLHDAGAEPSVTAGCGPHANAGAVGRG
jgi:hypothetical protein